MPSVKKRGDTYRIMVSQGYDIYGKQIRKTTSYTPPDGVTEGKAEKLALAYAYEFEKRCQGMVNMNENIRFSELAEWYYSQVAVHKLKPATYSNNRTLMDLYVLPYIGNMKLKEINTARIDALFNELHRDGRKRETYRLRDVATLEYGTRRPLSPIFSTAVKKELLLKNPVTNATTPAGEEKERLYLDAEQCKELMTFLDEFSNPQLPRVIKTLMYTGMRVGELTALHWDEVDLDRAMITVKYNLYRLDGEYRLSTPKTKSSARVIALPPQLVEILREQKVWQDERRKAVGSRWLERGAVFTGSYGEYMAKSYINLQFKQLLKKHNFPDIHIHDLRHANASLLINMGVPVKVISEHLGHSDTRTTETIYAHVFAETMVQASNAISEALATVEE